MKQLLILTTFLSSMIIPSVAHAEWTKVDENIEGDSYYVDFERIKKHDGKTYFWQLSDLLKPVRNGSISGKSYVEAECGRFRYRWLNQTYYKGPMATGEVNSSYNLPDKNWNYPPPNSVAETKLKAVCNHKSMQ